MINQGAKIRINPRLYPRYSAPRGFSLLELLIYIGVLAIIGVVVVGIFMSLSKSQGQSEARSEVDSNLRFAIEKITQDLHVASAVATPATAGATSGTLIMTIGANTITYDVSNGQLRRQIDSGAPQAITTDAVVVNTITSPLVFTRLENSNSVFSPVKKYVSIKVDMNISYNSSSPDWQYSESKRTTISLR